MFSFEGIYYIKTKKIKNNKKVLVRRIKNSDYYQLTATTPAAEAKSVLGHLYLKNGSTTFDKTWFRGFAVSLDPTKQISAGSVKN